MMLYLKTFVAAKFYGVATQAFRRNFVVLNFVSLLQWEHTCCWLISDVYTLKFVVLTFAAHDPSVKTAKFCIIQKFPTIWYVALQHQG